VTELIPMKRKGLAREFWQYLIDASSLINIEHKEGIKALEDRRGAILISERIKYEVAEHPNVTKTDPLRQFVERNPQIITQFQDNEGEEYLQILRQPGIDSGEASVIAIALKRGLPLVIDEGDRKATGKAKNHGIEPLIWQEFLRRS
jgi:predicted nucleic acid-binding protein